MAEHNGDSLMKKVHQPISPELETIGTKILDAAYKIHTALGPGLLESVYEACLAYEIRNLGLQVETQVAVPVKYNDVLVETGLRLDIWVERQVILELKAVEQMNSLYQAQLITYLKITGCRLGYLMNFNVQHFRDGFKRIIY
jgi:GxxExxY protein